MDKVGPIGRERVLEFEYVHLEPLGTGSKQLRSNVSAILLRVQDDDRKRSARA